MKGITIVPKKKRGVIVALDVTPQEAIRLASQLDKGTIVKVAPTLYFKFPPILEVLLMMGMRVMWDFKSKDIPFQVHGSVDSYLRTGFAFFTVHADGGSKMLAEAVEARDLWMSPNTASMDAPRVLAVTVLTTMDEDDLREVGVNCRPVTQVKRLVEVAKGAGVDGFVCSPREASIIRKIVGDKAFIVTPGIRFPDSDVSDDDQKRVGTPQGAIENGASHIVVGRPITQADDPVAAYQRFLDAVQEVA